MRSCAGSTTARHRSRAASARSGRRRGQGTADLGVGTEQHEELARRGVLGDERPAAHRPAALAGSLGVPRWVADTRWLSAAHPAPVGVPPGMVVSRPARARTVTRGCRRSTSAPPRAGAGAGRCCRRRLRRLARAVGTGREHAEVGTEDRGDPVDDPGLGELHRPPHPVAVGEGERGHAELGGPGDQGGWVRGAVAQRVAGGDVEVDEGVGGHAGFEGRDGSV